MQRDDDKGEYWEEGCQVLGEWNDHEHHEKEEVPEGWKIHLDVWKGYLGAQDGHRVSQCL